ncbi:MAG: tRNA (adenosine(37)-N6)-threonylcarbamoyltransferase complex ATPase subunit type 1 TsaE [Treponemataceae bacterium]|jgi:tRNA threonylcarbamoyladenosine biosynthesis protein TsaE
MSANASETIRLGERIGRALRAGTILALRGGLAAGKTTLTKGIAAGLDIDADVTSPTYTLISEYSGRMPLYHMDAYRLDGVDDFLALGVEEYLYGDGVCVIEWSERVAAALPKSAAIIELKTLSDGKRMIVIEDQLLEDLLR